MDTLLLAFIKSVCQTGDSCHCSVKEFTVKFAEWVKQNSGQKPWTNNRVMLELVKQYPIGTMNKTLYVAGVSLTAPSPTMKPVYRVIDGAFITEMVPV